MSATAHRCAIVPPYLLATLADRAGPPASVRAARTLQRDAVVRDVRPGAAAGLQRTAGARAEVRPPMVGTGAEPDVEPAPERTVSDAANGETLPGTRVRGEGDPPVEDIAVNEAYDGLGATWQLYWQVYRRNSLDDAGLPLLATVHFGDDYDNAYWDGSRMVFGDGDGEIFGRFTAGVDVIGHELTHGVTELTAGLAYRDQPGALNESISDVFGSLVRQRVLGQRADEADWLIGSDLLLPGVDGVALRSMKAPGTAYDDPVLGTDPQPADMAGYVQTSSDNGGVHVNSGIPNRAFYLVSAAIGGFAWEKAGWIWYAAVTGAAVRPDTDFAAFADVTAAVAAARFGARSAELDAVLAGWEGVGVPVTAPATGGGDGGAADSGEADPGGSDAPGDPGDSGDSGDPDDGSDRLVIRRSGGVTGISVEHAVRLADLPADDAAHWARLLADVLPDTDDVEPAPDRFVYQLVVPPMLRAARKGGPDITVGEQQLPPEVRELLRRTLRRG